jgi:hypothetical protein
LGGGGQLCFCPVGAAALGASFVADLGELLEELGELLLVACAQILDTLISVVPFPLDVCASSSATRSPARTCSASSPRMSSRVTRSVKCSSSACRGRSPPCGSAAAT